MTRRVTTTTRRNAGRDMTKAMTHAAAEPPVGRHRSTPIAAPAPVSKPAPTRSRARKTMPGM